MDAGPAASRRVFVAIRVPLAVARSLLALALSVAEPGDRIRWVDPADLHLTVWFIGALDPGALPALGARLAAAAAAARPVTCRLVAAGDFGRGGRRATWVGLAEPGARRVKTLAASLDAGPFEPHVTVARGAPAALATAIGARLVGAAALAWRATSIELLRSHPGRGPAYETMAAFTLGRPGA